jgi:tetratricopeptide (TPR) repeat protein
VSADGTARIQEVLAPFGTVPGWLPELAEAIAEKRLEDRRVVLVADDQAYWRLRRMIAAGNDSDEYVRWAKWFFAAREERLISPGASLTHADWLEECLSKESPLCLQEALRAAPMEPLPLSALVHANLAAASTNSAALAAAEWLSRYTAQRWPESAPAWQARTEVLRRNGKLREALEAVQRALDLRPEPSLWLLKSHLLESQGELAGAAQACASGLCLLSNSAAYSPGLHQRLAFQRINAWRQLGHQQEASAELMALKPFPARDLQTPANALDLTLCFNARLDEDWHRRTDLGNNLASLTPGVHTLEGIPFDVRGVIQLTAQIRDLDPVYPERIGAIAVHRLCSQVHFLHGAGWSSAEGTIIGYWIIHWVDGHHEPVPVLYGKDVRQWQFWPNMSPETGGASPVWTGTQSRWNNRAGAGVRLYRTTWANPHPDIAVATIDFVSAQARSAPFLLAITVE